MLIDDRGSHPDEFPSVVTTNHEGGASAARHLLADGRSRPLVITGPEQFGCVRDRLGGFREVLPTDLVAVGDFTELSGRLAVERLLAAGTPFDSVFAHNDISAAGALRALRAAGRSVPDDIAVVGFDDIPMAQHTEPPLTTVRQPTRRMGRRRR